MGTACSFLRLYMRSLVILLFAYSALAASPVGLRRRTNGPKLDDAENGASNFNQLQRSMSRERVPVSEFQLEAAEKGHNRQLKPAHTYYDGPHTERHSKGLNDMAMTYGFCAAVIAVAVILPIIYSRFA